MHNDFLMRQIEFITTAVAEIVFSKPSSKYEIQNEVRQLESDLLYALLCKMLDKKDINGAENLLFDMIESENHDHLLIATDFYNKVSHMSDEELIEADFSKSEIERGLNDVKAIYRLPI